MLAHLFLLVIFLAQKSETCRCKTYWKMDVVKKRCNRFHRDITLDYD